MAEDEYEQERNAYRRVRSSWKGPTLARGRFSGQSPGSFGRRPRKAGATAARNRHGEPLRPGRNQQPHQRTSASSARAASAERRVTSGRHRGHARHSSETGIGSPGRVRRAGYDGGWGRKAGGRGNESEEEFGGWLSAPEGDSDRGGGTRSDYYWVGGGSTGRSVGAGAGWRGRGALGRRPASREAARQLRVSERLHRQAQTMDKKKEMTRRRRDDLQQARVSATSAG